ncbi:MAG: acyl-CoA dehydrogenase family protein [Hyphomicrobiaceae bacterium]
MTQRFATHEVFNQTPPLEDVNLFLSDGPLRSAVSRGLGSAANETPAGTALEALAAFGAVAGGAEAAEWARQANAITPVLETHDARGNRCDRVLFHPAYHNLMGASFAHGVHRLDEETDSPHVMRAAKLYLAAQMEAGHCCPLTMTNAAMPVLAREPELAALWGIKAAATEYDPSFQPATAKSSVTLGMGMTEKQGGSDVRANTTVAEPEGRRGSGQAYRITGHKWFMSAPMSDAFLVLAQAQGGLTCFLMPRFTPDGAVNSIHFQRLKAKLGNRSNASSEVEFLGAYGMAIGDEGEGTRVIIDMVTLTRLDCAVSSAALMRQALSHAIHHARHRTAFQKKLIDQPLMTHVLAALALDVEAAVALVFRLARAFDTPGEEFSHAWRRLMTPIVKYWICKSAPPFVAEAMECLGGNGYVETGPLARIYREVPVNSIWEGSGNIMALDVVRVLRREPELAQCLLEEARPRSKRLELIALRDKLATLLGDAANLEANARTLCEGFALYGAASLLERGASAAVADGFSRARLSRDHAGTYGTARLADPRAIIESAGSSP